MLASTRALLEKKKKKKKKTRTQTHTQTNSPQQNITVGFYRIKKYCSYQKLWRFFCDFLPAPIDRKFDVRDNRHIDRSIDRRFTEGGKMGGPNVSTPFKIEQWQTTHLKDNRLACGVGHIKTFCDDVIITLWRHQVGQFFHFLWFFHFAVDVTSTFFKIEQQTTARSEDSRLASNWH